MRLLTCCSTDVSSASLGHTSINTPSEVEDADVSSAPACGQARGASLGGDDCRSSGAGDLSGGLGQHQCGH